MNKDLQQLIRDTEQELDRILEIREKADKGPYTTENIAIVASCDFWIDEQIEYWEEVTKKYRDIGNTKY